MGLPDWVTDEVLDLFAALSPQQRNAILRIVDAEIAGVPLAGLFRGEKPICNESTFYRRKPAGWHWQEKFQAALRAAREVAWSFSMENAVADAVRIITVTAPVAARELQRQVTQGERDGDKRAAAKTVLDRADRQTATKAEVFDLDAWKRERGQRLAAVAELEGDE